MLLEVRNVDHLVGDLVGVLEALQLRQTHVDRHLATFERSRDLLACLGALRTATSGLTFRCLTAADAGLGLVRALRWAQVMKLDGFAHIFLLPRHFFDRDQVANHVDHPAHLRGVGLDD